MFTKGKGPGDVPPAFEPPVDASRKAVVGGRGASIVLQGVVIKGAVTAATELQLDGEIEGDVRASTLTIGEAGRVRGNVAAERVIVKGTVEGQIRAREVRLSSGCTVTGDIFHAQLQIESNARFEGQVRFVQDPLKTESGVDLAVAPSHSSSSDFVG